MERSWVTSIFSQEDSKMFYLFKHVFILHLLIYFVFVYVDVCVCSLTYVWYILSVWRSADNLWDLVLYCHSLHLGGESQVGCCHWAMPTNPLVTLFLKKLISLRFQSVSHQIQCGLLYLCGVYRHPEFQLLHS